MICCLIAAAFLAGSLVKRERLMRYLGFVKPPKEEKYGYRIYCELDEYKS